MLSSVSFRLSLVLLHFIHVIILCPVLTPRYILFFLHFFFDLVLRSMLFRESSRHLALGCLPELDAQPLLLKTLYLFFSSTWKNKGDTDQEVSFLLLSCLHATRRCNVNYWEKKLSGVLPNCEPCELQK